MDFDKPWLRNTMIGLAAVGAFVGAKVSMKAFKMASFWLKKPTPLEMTYGKNTWAMVTGGSKGIGNEFAHQLAKKGFNIMIVDISKKSNAEAVKELSEKYKNIKVNAITGDITTTNEIEKIAKENDISILINAAGIAVPGPYTAVPFPQHANVINVNCLGTAKVTHAVMSQMEKRQGKSLVVMMSSYADFVPFPYNSAYAASKVFMLSMAKSLRSETVGKIDVAALRPLYVATRLASFLDKNDKVVVPTEAFVSSSIKDIEKGRFDTYGHWKHKLMAESHQKYPFVAKRIQEYLDKCNKTAYDFVLEYNKKMAAKAAKKATVGDAKPKKEAAPKPQ